MHIKRKFHIIPIFVIITLFMTGCGQSIRVDVPEAWAQPVASVNVPNLHMVTPELYRAAQPDAAAMQALAEMGIKTIISLRHSKGDRALTAGTGMTLVELPVSAGKAGNDAFVLSALQAICDAEKPVLIHCMHGADRTGLVIAMYRVVEQGWDKEATIDEMTHGGYGFHSIYDNLPTYIRNADVASLRQALK